MSDWLYYVDGELDDVSPEERAELVAAERARRDPGYHDRTSLDEFRAELAREAAEEWRAEEEATELEDRDRELRGERDQDRRA